LRPRKIPLKELLFKIFLQMLHISELNFILHQRIRDRAIWQNINMPPKVRIDNLLAELKKRLKISIFLWRKSCASR